MTSDQESNKLQQASSLLRWAMDVAKRHPLAGALGVLVILAAVTVSFGRNDNAEFINLLIVLFALAGAIHASFVPSFSSMRMGAGVLLCAGLSSLMLDTPIQLRTFMRTALAASSTSAASPVSAAQHAISPAGAYTEVECGQTTRQTVEFVLPEDATDVTYHATWANPSNVQRAERTVRQEGLRVIAEGSITGLNHQQILGFQNCPGGGHATLVLTGSYRTPRS